MAHDEQEQAPDPEHSITARERAMLRAVAAGRAEMTWSCEPDLFVDGLACCDQYTAHRLTRAGFVRPAERWGQGRTGAVRRPDQRVLAELTAAGRAVIALPLAASA